MKRTVLSLLLIMILCCGTIFGCKTDSNPSGDDISAEIDSVNTVVVYSAWNGKEMAFTGETIYTMTYSVASEIDVNSDHTVNFKFKRFNPTVKREEILLSIINSAGERQFVNSITDITEEKNGLKIALKFDEEKLNDNAIFVLSFHIYWNDEFSGEVFVSMRSL